MIEPGKIKKALGLCKQNFDCPDECPYKNECTDLMKPMFIDLAQDALEYIETLEERVAIMTEGKEVKYTPEKGKLYDEEYWLCVNCNEPIEIGTVERKHLRNYCYLCGAKIDQGDENEDQR